MATVLLSLNEVLHKLKKTEMTPNDFPKIPLYRVGDVVQFEGNMGTITNIQSPRLVVINFTGKRNDGTFGHIKGSMNVLVRNLMAPSLKNKNSTPTRSLRNQSKMRNELFEGIVTEQRNAINDAAMIIRDKQGYLTSEQRRSLWAWIAEGYCELCGDKIPEGHKCYCAPCYDE